MTVFDPTNASIPYVYDDFQWAHCAEEGIPIDMIMTDDDAASAGSSTSRTTGSDAGLPGGGQGHAETDDDDGGDATVTAAADTPSGFAVEAAVPPIGSWW